MRIATRFIVKPGDLFGNFEGTEFNERVRKIVSPTPDVAPGACMLGGTLAEHVPAVHVSGLGMYGEKFPFCRVTHHATVRTVYLTWEGEPNKNKHDHIEVCVLLRPDWATLRYGTPKGEQYDEEPTWVEFQPVEHVVSLRGIYIEWFRRGMDSFTAKDVAEWLAEKSGRDFLRGPQHQRAARLLLEGEVNVTNAMSTMIPYVRLEREGRWRYTWRYEHCEAGPAEAFARAAIWCGMDEHDVFSLVATREARTDDAIGGGK